jgi:hypothetical protein
MKKINTKQKKTIPELSEKSLIPPNNINTNIRSNIQEIIGDNII